MISDALLALLTHFIAGQEKQGGLKQVKIEPVPSCTKSGPTEPRLAQSTDRDHTDSSRPMVLQQSLIMTT